MQQEHMMEMHYIKLYKHLPTSCDRVGSPRNRPGRSLHKDE